jgi:2-C-methyl-D-erythritol 4-phosphate cytidylyltransferase
MIKALGGIHMAGFIEKMIHADKKDKAAHCSVVVAAAGSSTRMGGQDKMFLELGGRPVLLHTLTALNQCPIVDEIVVVARAGDIGFVATLCKENLIEKAVKVIAGGDSRLNSVYNGVQAVSQAAEIIAVHDGARPFVTECILAGVVNAAAKYSAAAPAVPVSSTIKQAKNGIVLKTVDRNELFEVQTPQAFSAELIKGALQNAIDKVLYITDDCMAVEALGCPVRLTEGSKLNIKITTQADIAFAETILRLRGTVT